MRSMARSECRETAHQPLSFDTPMNTANEGYRRFPQILNGPGTLRQRLIDGFLAIIPYPARSYPDLALHKDFLRLLAEATRDPGPTGALKATIGKMGETECESMKQSLLRLAARVMCA
jgi:hypothetical protein